MKNSYTGCIILALIILMCSCKKDSTKFNQNEDYLTSQRWRVLSIKQNINNSGWVDIFSPLADCQKDDLTLFNTDNTVYHDVGLTKCSQSELQSHYLGTWSFSSDGKKITFYSEPNRAVDLNVLLLDKANLITLTNYISGNDTSVVETRYIH